MATRDLHDQKILRALEGIEKQLKVQNGIFGDMSAGVNCNMKCKEKDRKIVTSNLRIFTNPDGSKTPILPSAHVRYYVRFTTKSGGDVTNITNGKALWDSNNVEVLNSAIEIYFYVEGRRLMIELLIFLAFIYILEYVLKIFISDYDKCYSEMENAGIAAFNCCCGLTGGTRHTDYLQENCVDCPYLVLSDNKGEKK